MTVEKMDRAFHVRIGDGVRTITGADALSVMDRMDAGLTGIQKDIWHLYFADGMQQCKIAALLGISQQAVSKNVKRIKKKAEKMLLSADGMQ